MILRPTGMSHMSRLLRGGGALLSGALLVGLLSPALPAQAAVAGTVRASVSTTGAQSKDGGYRPVLSGDGRFVAFNSSATTFDWRCRTPNRTALYVRDLQLGRIECVSVDDAGVQVAGGVDVFTMSGDGRYVAYRFNASDSNFGSDVYVYDRQTRTRRQIDPGHGRDRVGGPSISANGKVVAFGYDDGRNTETSLTLRVRDLATGALTTIPRAAASLTCLSADGRYLFHFGPIDDQARAVVRFDRVTGQRRFVALDQGQDNAQFSCNADGRKVVFTGARPLVKSDTNGVADVYLVTLSPTGRTLRQVSRDPSGGQRTGPSAAPAISPDGNYISYTSQPKYLPPNVINTTGSTYAINLTTNVTWLVSRSPNGTPATPGSVLEVDSDITTAPSGHAVTAYATPASNLVPCDTNNQYDVFVTSLG